MKHSVELVIKKPIARVIELFDNPALMTQWQDGLVAFEHVSGTPGQPGAKSKLTYQAGNRTVEMIETVTKRDLPHAFFGTYEAPGVLNSVENHFTDLGGISTQWRMNTDFKFSGFLKFMGFLMPGMFTKQIDKMMNDFKKFAESYEG